MFLFVAGDERLFSTINRYSENYYNTLRNISMFNKKMDWSHELLRCGATGWRVLSREREDKIPERTLPMHYVIPKTVTEIEYIKLAESFNRSRAAIWVSWMLAAKSEKKKTLVYEGSYLLTGLQPRKCIVGQNGRTHTDNNRYKARK